MVGLVLLERGFTPHPPPPQSLLYTMGAVHIYYHGAVRIYSSITYTKPPPPLSTHHPHRSTHLQSRSKSAFRKLYGLSI